MLSQSVLGLAVFFGATPPLLAPAALPSATSAPDLPRVVVVIDEVVDGKKANTTSAATALSGALTKDGYRVLSGEMAEKLRSAQAVSMALSGGIPEVLSSLDADIAILGQVETSKIGSIPEVNLVGYRAAAVVKLVRIDTAQIADAFNIEAKGQDFTDAGAAQKAAKNVGDELAKQIKASVKTLSKRAQSIDLVVHGIPDRAAVESLKAALAKTGGIRDVIVRQSGKGVSKIELSIGTDTESLATQLEKDGLPLEIVQTSSGAILARYDVRRGVRLGATLLSPSVKLAARGAWAAKVLPELVESELANVTYLDVVERGGDVKIAIDAKAHGKDVALTLTARDARDAKLFTASGTGKLEDLPALVSTVVKKLDDGFLPALARGKSARGNTALARAAAVGKGKAQAVALPVAEVKLEELKLENLFPSKLGYYAANPVGSLVLQHSDAKGAPAVDVTVSVYVPRFMQMKSEVVVGTLEPGERREVPIRLTLDNNTVFATEENTPTQAEVSVEYTVAGGKMDARRVAPLIVYGRRAIDWTESTPIAAFVTPQEEYVRGFARGALIDVDNKLPEPVAQAIAIFQAMSSAQLKYVKDPAIPARSGALDTVQFPRETLTLKSGDCDDLSVLYASLLESIGVETAFLLVPGHVLVGVAAGVPPEAIDRLTFDSSKIFVNDGKAYVPVETTAVGKSFRDAWTQGAHTVGRLAGKSGDDGIIVVETRQGWSRYPPAALPRAAGLQVPRPDPKKNGAADEVRSVVAARDDARKQKLEQLAAVVKKDAGAKEASELASLLARGGEVKRAQQVLRAALEKKPGSVTLTNNLANVEVLGGDAAAAVARYRSILAQAGPRRGDVLTNLGIAYTQAGDQQKAIEAFDAALQAGASSTFLATGFERNPDVKAPVVVRASNTRASDEGKLTVAEQELRSILAKALEKRKQNAQKEAARGAKPTTANEAAKFANPLPSGARRGDDPESKLRTAELLRWM